MTTEPVSGNPPDPNDEQPEIYSVRETEDKLEFNRRHFLGVSGAVAAGTLVVGVTGTTLAGNSMEQNPTRTLRPTRTPISTEAPVGTPTPTLSGVPCTVRTSQQGVYVHVGPGSYRGILDYLPVDKDFKVIGKGKSPKEPDGPYWWKIQLYDYEQEAWVNPDDVEISGDCELVADVDAPPFVPAKQPTEAPEDTPVPVDPGTPGTVPPGQTGINYTGPNGQTFTLPCGSAIPPGAVCICNCVSVPPSCACQGYNPCSCAGASHYWYPN
jgi:hypothetical protein